MTSLPPIPPDWILNVCGESTWIQDGRWVTATILGQEAYDNMKGYKFEDGRRRPMKDSNTPFKVYLYDTGVWVAYNGAPEVIIEFLPNGYKVQLHKGHNGMSQRQVSLDAAPYQQDEYIYTYEEKKDDPAS